MTTKIRAEMGRLRIPFCPQECMVDKVAEIPNVQFSAFMMNPVNLYEFIEKNQIKADRNDGITHCLLVLCEGRMDGILMECGGYGDARCSAYISGARDVVQANLDRVSDFIIRQGTERTVSGSWCVYCEELNEKLGVAIYEGNGLDAMLKETLERRPEVANVNIRNGAIDTSFHPEFCAELRGSAEEHKPDIRLQDILPLLTGGGLTFLTHEEADTSVLAENLRELTPTGRENHAALLNARVSEISSGLEGTEVVLTDVDPQELARFNMACEAHQEAEQAMGPTM